MHLRIATLNVWALPFGLARDSERRLRAIAERLPTLELDAIAFQEVWTPEARAALLAGGRRAGLTASWDRAGSRGRSGLMLLSRHPIESARFAPYALRGIAQRLHHGDYLSGKGFVVARLATPAGPVAVADTHLHAQYAPDGRDEYHGHRTGQIAELALALREVRELLVGLGDFNMREGRPEYRIFTALTGLDDVAARLGRRQPTAMAENPYRSDRWDRESRIDYVFARPDGTHGLSVWRVFDEPLRFEGRPGAYSDHAGVLAELEIRTPGVERVPDLDAAMLDQARAILRAGRASALARRRGERWTAAGAGLAALAALRARRAGGETRRRFLRRLASALGVTALPVGSGALLLSEHLAPEELRAFDAVLGQLAAARAQVAISSRRRFPTRSA